MRSTLLPFSTAHVPRPPGSRVWARVGSHAGTNVAQPDVNPPQFASRNAAKVQGTPPRRLARLPTESGVAGAQSADGGAALNEVPGLAATPGQDDAGASAAPTMPVPAHVQAGPLITSVAVRHGDSLWRGRGAPQPRPNVGCGTPGASWTSGLPPVQRLATGAKPRTVVADSLPPAASECFFTARHGTQALSAMLEFSDLQKYLRRQPNRRYHNLMAYMHDLQAREKTGRPATLLLALDGAPASLQSLDIAHLHSMRDAQVRFGALTNRALAMEGLPVVQAGS